MSGARALVVMARYPALGEVKTRLVAHYGATQATALYRAFLSDLDARFHQGPRRLVWAYHPATSPFAEIVHDGAYCLPQQGDDLAARMLACFRTLGGEGFSSVVMIGADAPHTRDAWIVEAEVRLEDVDVVLGPSADGGYFLVAMRKPHDIFSGVTMSTPSVLADTQHIIAAAGLRAHLLSPSFDVDEAADVERLRDELSAPDLLGQLPATAAWFALDRPT